MKMTLVDDEGAEYDVEFESGADIPRVMEKAALKAGRPLHVNGRPTAAMQLTLADDEGSLYDVEYQPGADLDHVLARAAREVGRPVRDAPEKKPEPPHPSERFLALEKEERARDAGEHRAQIDKITGERDGLTKELAAEREATRKASAGRLEAVSQGREAGAKLYAAEQALKAARDECADLKAACADLRAQLKDAKVTPAPRTGWTITPFRNAAGFARSYDVEPK